MATLLIAQAAQAAETTLVTPERQNRPAVVAIRKHLNAGDENKFHNVTSGMKHAVVFLDFGGGNLNAAVYIGMEIKMRHFQTAVVDDGDQLVGGAYHQRRSKKPARSPSRRG